MEDEKMDTREDPSGWLLHPNLADFFLMDARAVRYMIMLGYTFYHGSKLFSTLPADSSLSFKFVSMIFQCTGGGILVPIFINSIPVSLAQDAYPVAIFLSFLLHQYVPILRDVQKQSLVFQTALTVLYEAMRAFVVTKLTTAAGAAIAPSEFAFPLFGPIFCGTIAGCGGAFLPLNKGLSPIQKGGLGQPMLSAFVAATVLHLFMNTSWSEGVVEPKQKAQIVMALFFIAYNVHSNILDKIMAATTMTTTTEKTVLTTSTMMQTTTTTPTSAAAKSVPAATVPRKTVATVPRKSKKKAASKVLVETVTEEDDDDDDEEEEETSDLTPSQKRRNRRKKKKTA